MHRLVHKEVAVDTEHTAALLALVSLQHSISLHNLLVHMVYMKDTTLVKPSDSSTVD